MSGILADEVGLGRTTQPIGMLAHLWAHEARNAHRCHAPSYCARYPPTNANWTVLDACAAVTCAMIGLRGCTRRAAAVPINRPVQSACATAPMLEHVATQINTDQLSVAGVRAVPHRRTACSYPRLVQSVQEAHARYAVHDLPRHVRLIVGQRALLPVTACSDFAPACAAVQRMAAAAGSKADRAALFARHLKHPGRKTFPIVRVQPSEATSDSLVTERALTHPQARVAQSRSFLV
jgi:hypothetical protein